MISEYLLRILIINYLKLYIGGFYTWGGDDPSGFDCSGFIIEGLKSVGKIERSADYTANDLYNMFTKVEKPQAGVLAFWYNKNKDRIIHVELCMNDWQTIGASGGGRKTITKEDAIRDNAFIKIRPIKENAVFADPFAIGG